jgi:hypothetical protein
MEKVVPIETAGAWRFRLGVAIFILAFALWLLVPLAVLMQVGAGGIAALTSTVFIGNKVLLVLVIAIMGKPGFQELKRRILVHASSMLSAEVSPWRHRIGLVMFVVPLISALVEPYVDAIAPDLTPDGWIPQVLGDLVLIASFFVLGRNFWEKAAALFVRTARVIDTSVEDEPDTPQPARPTLFDVKSSSGTRGH